MAGKFVDLNEAAKMIGVSPDELIELRSKGEIFGYRDGASWKFKLEEVERVISTRSGGGVRGSDSSAMSLDDEEFITGLSSKILAEKAQEESGSILVSEEELGVSATGSSTIIGKGRKPSDSDIQLASESDIKPGSDKLLEAPGSKLQLGADAGDVLSGSDIKIKGGSGTGDMPGPKPGSSGGGLDLGPTLSLDEREESDSDSALDEVKLDRGPGGTGSGKGSDVTLGTGDSGINLAPTDSGLSLEEEPLELGGSGVDSLELPEDEEVISLDAEAADPDQATQLKADNEFLLAPGEKAEDESDSGSQVIALEDSEAFDQDAATMLGAQQAAAPVLTADAFQPVGADLGAGMAAPGMAMAAGQPVYVQVPAQELPYSVWNVLSLGAVALLLALGGMLMTDVMLNMWSFGGTTSASTQVMDFFIKTFNLDA
jgi:Helix-turn-helix domain